MKREPVITGEAQGLKCDAPGCGWSDMTIKRSEYEAHIDAPCPDCGANILTAADYRTLLKIERAFRWVNKWLWWLPRGKPRAMHITSDGTGKMKVKEGHA